jgi:hypothetical protein
MKFAEPDKPEWAIPEGARTYAEWLATPAGDRMPLTKNALAIELEVNRKTMTRWEQSVWWPALMIETSGSQWGFGYEQDMDVLQALQAKAAAGDVNAIKTYMELRRLNAPKEAPKEDPKDLTDEELAAAAERIMQRTKLHAV